MLISSVLSRSYLLAVQTVLCGPWRPSWSCSLLRVR